MIGAKNLRIRTGSGIYQTGRERVVQILETALEIIVEDGYQALTLREVARRCDIQIGAVSYYYKSRSDLLQDVINMVLVPYADNIVAILREPDLSAEQKLERFIRYLLDDIQTRRTTRLFPHLWALSNHDPLVAKAVDSIYLLERHSLKKLIAELNPGLKDQEREVLAVYISASIAGATMFVGSEKPWAGELTLYSAITSHALVTLTKSITAEQLASFGWNRDDLKLPWKTPTLLTDEEYHLLFKRNAERGDANESEASANDKAGGPGTLRKGRHAPPLKSTAA